ncbi:MAG: cytochrome c biogenesis protein ResB, partial [Micrococcales bacterium]|nr:cytochrome c biogenesis protein ResB [Micrococcales bacterium]
DSNLTSIGVVKVPDAPKQFGMMAFFYPTVGKLKTGAFTSVYPALVNPILSMNVFVGKLGLEDGLNTNVFELNTHAMKQVAGGKSGTKAIQLEPGQIKQLPEGLGSVEFRGVKRFASLDITYNPMELWVLIFAILTLTGLVIMLITPRRRLWVKKTASSVEVAALAKSKDQALGKIVSEVAKAIKKKNK